MVCKYKQNAVKGNEMVNHDLHEIKCVPSFASLKRQEKKRKASDENMNCVE